MRFVKVYKKPTHKIHSGDTNQCSALFTSTQGNRWGCFEHSISPLKEQYLLCWILFNWQGYQVHVKYIVKNGKFNWLFHMQCFLRGATQLSTQHMTFFLIISGFQNPLKKVCYFNLTSVIQVDGANTQIKIRSKKIFKKFKIWHIHSIVWIQYWIHIHLRKSILEIKT